MKSEVMKMEINDLEYGVDQKREGRLKVRMICLLTLYIGFAVGAFIVIFSIPLLPLGAIVPVLVYILVLCTWRFVQVEQKYKFNGGLITVTRKFGNSRAKEIISFRLKEAEKIAPVASLDDDLSKIESKNIYSALPSEKCDGAYGIIYSKDGVKKALLIQVTDQTLKGLKYYNDKTVVQ